MGTRRFWQHLGWISMAEEEEEEEEEKEEKEEETTGFVAAVQLVQ